MHKTTFHLIANAHLDPVWLWDWRDGLTEGITTTRAVLDLMDEFDELTFVRGEAVIYQHIEKHDPRTFKRILKYAAAGRWDVVGGTVVQPDTNLPATETFARHFARSQHYFKSRFGRIARVAWAADSFGHCAGLPEIMVAAGITGFACSRPEPHILPLAKPAFWWEGPGGSRILAYRPPTGWYGTQRDEMTKRLDALLQSAQGCDLEHVGVFYGLGNHGGGPSRRHLREIRAWADAHPEIQMVHSGLHRFFDALAAQARRDGPKSLPVHRGELNFCLRGCYTSVAKYKFAYRKTEAALLSAERTNTVIRSALRQPLADTGDAWDNVLFNTFHDILPGSSIERAFDDQLAWLGGALHTAQSLELDALTALAQRVDTRVAKPEGDHPSAVAVLAWNPNPWPYRGHVEWEANLDYRQIDAYKGRPDAIPLRVLSPDGCTQPFQSVATEHALAWDVSWRKRVVVPVELPPCGWNVFEFGWVEGAVKPAAPGVPCTAAADRIDNVLYRVQARPGETGVRVFRQGRPVFGRAGLSAVVVADPWGSWGGPNTPEANNLSDVLETWPITHVEVLENGPLRARLFVRFAGARSRLDLTFSVYCGREAVDVSARMLWNEREARLKLVMPVGAKSAEYEVPGARITRDAACGEVPGGRWVRAHGVRGAFGFASDAIYGFDLHQGALRASLVRASGYASGSPPKLGLWRPAVDCGELTCRFLINPGDNALPRLAQELEQPPAMLVVPASPGAWPRTGTVVALAPASLQLLAIKRAEDGRGLVVRAQSFASRPTRATLTWQGRAIDLGTVAPGTIATWRLQQTRGAWRAVLTTILEEK